jgi:hypothetical protein
VTEAEARAVLRAFEAIADVEPWIAAQRWEPILGGWRVRGQFHGRWRFLLEPVPGGLRVVMSSTGGAPADWVVPARR